MLPSNQIMAAMPIVLNFESRGLSGFIIALYLMVDFNQIWRCWVCFKNDNDTMEIEQDYL